MANATVVATGYNGASPSGTNIDSGASGTAPVFGASDAVVATGTVAVPTTTGTNYSWFKNWGLSVSVAGTTNISNRRIALNAALPTGLALFFKDAPSYTQGAAMTASGSAGPATPAGWTKMTTTNQVWDATSHASSATGLNGDYVQITAGVDNSYAGGGGSTPLSNVLMSYDEGP